MNTRQPMNGLDRHGSSAAGPAPRAGEPAGAAATRRSPLLICGASLLDGRLLDLRIDAGVIVAMAAGLPPLAGERVFDARGGLVLPGLHDHHIHLFATAAARPSLVCGPPSINTESELREALAHRAATGEGWIRGVAFHDSVCDRLDRHWLDAVCHHRPVRIQHRSGMLWVLNSAAIDCLAINPAEPLPEGAERDAAGDLTGRFYDLDAWLGPRLARAWPSLASLSAELARHGITAVTDTGANNGVAAWRALCSAVDSGELRQRLLVMGTEELNGLPPACGGRVAVGPVKIYLREAALPDFDRLVARMAAAHRQGRAVAVHCVTRVEITVALAALREAGAVPGDRIEHAAVADDSALRDMAELGVTAVTQPHFIAERGDQYLGAVDALDLPLLYRGEAFLRAGVPLAAGSDAPYGGIDPWAAMAAAVARRTRQGVAMAPQERLSPLRALALHAGEPHSPGTGLHDLGVGQPADLVLFDVDRRALLDDLDARHVRLTLVAGEEIYRATTGSAGETP